MADKVQRFEGTPGVQITDANTGGASGDPITPPTTAGDGMAVFATGAAMGATCARVTGSATTGQYTMSLLDTGATSARGQLRFYQDSTKRPTTAALVFFRSRNSSANVMKLVLTTAGVLSVQNAAGTGLKNFNGGAALADGWYIIGFQIIRATTTSPYNGTINVQVYRQDTQALVDSYASNAVNTGTANIIVGSAGKPEAASGGADILLDHFLFGTGSSVAYPIEWDGSATLGVTAGLTAAGTLPAAGSATLGTTAGLTATGTVPAAGSATLGTTAGLTATGTVPAAGSATLGTTAGLTATPAAVTIPAAATLGTTAGLTATGTRGTTAAATLGTTAGLTTTGRATVNASATVSVTAGLTVTGGGQSTLEGAATLATTAGLTATGTPGREASAVLTVRASLASSAGATVHAVPQLQVTAGLTTAATGTATATVVLPVTASLATTGGALTAAVAVLLVRADLTATAYAGAASPVVRRPRVESGTATGTVGFDQRTYRVTIPGRPTLESDT